MDKQIKLGQCLSHSHITVIGYCDILDVVTILALPNGSHNIRYPVYRGYFERRGENESSAVQCCRSVAQSNLGLSTNVIRWRPPGSFTRSSPSWFNWRTMQLPIMNGERRASERFPWFHQVLMILEMLSYRKSRGNLSYVLVLLVGRDSY